MKLTDEERRAIWKGLDGFFEAVRDRMYEQGDKGYRGWDGDYPAESLRHEMLWDALDTFHTAKADKLIDIAARCMMLWRRQP